MPRSTPARDSATLDQFSALAQRQASSSRNLVNADELKPWLQDLLASRFGSNAEDANGVSLPPRQPACERWTLSVARKWMIRQGQTESHQPAGDALAQSPAWVRQAISNGTPPQRLCLLSSERETLAGVLDWMRSDNGPALASDWSRISVEQAIASEKTWVDAMAKAALKKDLEAADAAGTTLFTDSPDPDPDGQTGWRWVQVQSKDALDREGALMRHCVGSYADDVAADRKSIYSLRDPDNKPRLTLETQQGKVAQLKAFANQPCPRPLLHRVADFATAFNALCQTNGWTLQASDEAQQAGLFAVPGLGLAIAGSPPPADFSTRFASDLEQPLPNVDILPTFAALGWTDLLQLATPHASAELVNQALVKASDLGQLCSVEFLLPHSDPKSNGSHALRWAASSGHLAIVELLLPHSEPAAYQSAALNSAAANGHLAIAQLLLPHSDPKSNNSQALISAARNGHLAIAQLLLPLSDPQAKDSEALSSAAANGHLAIARLLLPRSDPKANDSEALRSAAGNGHLVIAQLLLPLSDPQAKDSGALRLAAEKGHIAVVELLLPHCDPKANNSWALRSAVDGGHFAIVKLLLPHSEPKANESQALRFAVQKGHLEIARLLSHSNPKDDNASALALAAHNGRLDMVELLIPRSDPKANNAHALCLAARNGHFAVVQSLLPHSDLQSSNAWPLCLAADRGHLAIVELLLPHLDSDAQSHALQAARANGFTEISQLLQTSLAAPAAPPSLDSLAHQLLHNRQRQSLQPSAPLHHNPGA